MPILAFSIDASSLLISPLRGPAKVPSVESLSSSKIGLGKSNIFSAFTKMRCAAFPELNFHHATQAFDGVHRPMGIYVSLSKLNQNHAGFCVYLVYYADLLPVLVQVTSSDTELFDWRKA